MSTSQSQVVSDFIASRSKLEELSISGYKLSSDVLPKNVKLPIKRLKLHLHHFNSGIQINCPEFMVNCRPTLEHVDGSFQLETYRVLMRSLKLTEMTWNAKQEVMIGKIVKFETNQSIKRLTIEEFKGEDALNALIQKFEALTSLEICNIDYATAIQSSKVTSLKLSEFRMDLNFWNRLKLNFPNIETLNIAHNEELYIADEILTNIADQEWNLKYLKIQVSAYISLTSLRYLLQNCPTLKTLIIPDDSLEYIREWSELLPHIIFFKICLENGLKVFVMSYIDTLEGSREVLTQISSLK